MKLFTLLFAASLASAQTQVEVDLGVLPNTTNGTLTIQLGKATTAGELIAVWNPQSGFCRLTNVTDSAGGVYVSAASYSLPGGHSSNFWYRLGAPAGITSISVTESCGQGAVFVGHYQVPTGTAFEQISAAPTATGNPWSSPPITTKTASELLIGTVFGLYNGANCNISPSGAWTGDLRLNSGNWDGTNGNGAMYSHQVVSSVQTVQNTGTDSGACNHYATVVAFSLGGATPPPPPPTTTTVPVCTGSQVLATIQMLAGATALYPESCPGLIVTDTVHVTPQSTTTNQVAGYSQGIVISYGTAAGGNGLIISVKNESTGPLTPGPLTVTWKGEHP